MNDRTINSPTAQVMILGTYHFKTSPGHAVDATPADVTSPQKQKEISEVIDALMKFRPTKIAVESPRVNDEKLNNLYLGYCNARLNSTVDPEGIDYHNEIVQLGFRLASLLSHTKIYPVDYPVSLPFDILMEYAKEHSHGFCQKLDEYVAREEKNSNEMQASLTVREIIKHYNSPRRISQDHDFYLNSTQVGAGDTYCGAQFLLAWYDRNIRIFSNLQDISEPNDRVLVIYGAGHCAILRELVNNYSDMELIDPLRYL